MIVTRDGHRVVSDRAHDELMHPFGPRLEADTLYVGGARLEARLERGPLTIFDVGLGAGTNAIAAWRAARGAANPIEIVSFDRTTEALRVALDDDPRAFGFDDAAAEEAARALLATGRHEATHARWRFVEGDLPDTLARVERRADVVFWDPYGPKANPALWSVDAFRALRAVCAERATVHTYAAATPIRAALLLAGFAVGHGPAIGTKAETTVAAVDARDLEAPLDERWFLRWTRSSTPLPDDAPADADARIRALFA